MIPRLVIAGTASGVGKTTVTVALTRALRSRGLSVATFKCGPDYLDPTYHARAAEGACHNLDGWMMGRDAVLQTFARATRGADIALVEGVMGLFDGASPTSDEGSTAEIAKWLARAGGAGLRRLGHGAEHRRAGRRIRELRSASSEVAAVIANRVGSRGHLELLRKASPVAAGPRRLHGRSAARLSGAPSGPDHGCPRNRAGRSCSRRGASAPRSGSTSTR